MEQWGLCLEKRALSKSDPLSHIVIFKKRLWCLNAGNILLVGAVLLFVSIIAGKAGHKFGVPVLLLFLGVGMLFGSDGLGIQFNSPTAAQFIGMVALSVILFSGGMDTKFSRIRPVLGPGIILATAGVMLTTFLTGGAIYLIAKYIFPQFSLTLYESLLLAAVMSSTDSASVFSILRSKGLKLKENLRPMLEFRERKQRPDGQYPYDSLYSGDSGWAA